MPEGAELNRLGIIRGSCVAPHMEGLLAPMSLPECCHAGGPVFHVTLARPSAHAFTRFLFQVWLAGPSGSCALY